MRVTCLIGGESVYIADDDPERNVHARLDRICTHCHEHGNADPAHNCGQNNCPGDHDGTCLGHGETPAERLNRPDGCLSCRPVIIEPYAIVTPAAGGGG